jgi:hypothetical protein
MPKTGFFCQRCGEVYNPDVMACRNCNPREYNKMSNLPEGITYDGTMYFATCPMCGWEQAEMGRSVKCENCDFFPMPSMNNPVDDDEVKE